MNVRLSVGTIGMSVWFSENLGESWTRPYSESGLYLESRVWSLSCHPNDPGRLYAGTDHGIFVYQANDKTWSPVKSPMDGKLVWSIAQAPSNPEILIVGTQPASLYRSDDSGKSWRHLPIEFAQECVFVQDPRVTQIIFDPQNEDLLWAGVEIDGIYHSRDAGNNWVKQNDGLKSLDIHGLALINSPTRRLFATTNKGLHLSEDDGTTWQFCRLSSDWQYCRAIVPSAGNENILFLTNGNGPPGDSGKLLRSNDGGRTWNDSSLPGLLNSTPWCIATNKADPDLLFAATNLGQLFRSKDGGLSWTKLSRELGEVRAIVWQNN